MKEGDKKKNIIVTARALDELSETKVIDEILEDRS
jgi:hypothetical protein